MSVAERKLLYGCVGWAVADLIIKLINNGWIERITT